MSNRPLFVIIFILKWESSSTGTSVTSGSQAKSTIANLE